jgi:hypothetical protein
VSRGDGSGWEVAVVMMLDYCKESFQDARDFGEGMMRSSGRTARQQSDKNAGSKTYRGCE